MDLDLDELLIEEVQKRPLLYNRGHEDYKDLKKKNRAWKEIARKLKTNETQCKNRWKALRISYRRCNKPDQANKKTPLGFPKAKWRLCKNLSFLDNVQKSGATANSTRTFQDVWLEVCDDLDSKDIKYPIDFDVAERLTPTFQATEPHTSKRERDEKSNQEKKFNVLELNTSNISQAFGGLQQKNNRSSTELLFESLASKIREVNLPMSISNQLSAKVVALVFSEIQAYQDYVYEANQ